MIYSRNILSSLVTKGSKFSKLHKLRPSIFRNIVLCATPILVYVATFDNLKAMCMGTEEDDNNNSDKPPKKDSNGRDSGKSDLVEELIKRVLPIMSPLGFGGCMGFCTGVVFRELGHKMAYVIGVSFVFLQSLSYMGYISVDYYKISKDAQNVLDADKDGKLTANDAVVMWRELKKVLVMNVPSAAAFSAGLVLGLRVHL